MSCLPEVIFSIVCSAIPFFSSTKYSFPSTITVTLPVAPRILTVTGTSWPIEIEPTLISITLSQSNATNEVDLDSDSLYITSTVFLPKIMSSALIVYEILEHISSLATSFPFTLIVMLPSASSTVIFAGLSSPTQQLSMSIIILCLSWLLSLIVIFSHIPGFTESSPVNSWAYNSLFSTNKLVAFITETAYLPSV